MAKRGGPSRPFQRANQPRQSAPARMDHEVIVIDSSDDDAPPPPPPPRPAPKLTETITISSSDSDNVPPKVQSPIRPKRQSLGDKPIPRPIASGSRPIRGRPRPQATTRKLSLAANDGAVLPPLPPSERDTPSPPQKSPSNPHVYRTTGGPSSDGDSQSSGEIIETRLVQQEQKSIVLGSGNSTSESESKPLDKASPRKNIPIPSSPTPETEPEPEPLLESIANVSLYDEQQGQDRAVAQAAEAVENVTLSPTEAFTCGVGSCTASFATAGQLHQHTSRDHGIRLQQNKRRKRKASDEHEDVPAKRRTTALPIASSVPASSRNTPASVGSQASDQFVQRKNTIGFEPFAQRVSDQESLTSDRNDIQEISSSGSPAPS
ncbi:unnamed protein product, partial [Rhizoctonia solani]